MRLDSEAVTTVLVTTIKNAIAPLIAELADVKRQLGETRLLLATYEARPPVPGPPGEPGPAGAQGDPGADGVGFDDLQVDFDGDRTIALAFVRGDERKAFPIVLPFLRYQGVFAQGTAYQVGDVVTHSGSAWHCQVETDRTPGNSDDWRLMVKQGRDGRRPDRAGAHG